MRIVIVGAVAGGASAAARARRLDENADIILLDRGREPSFANCGMPYYIGGEIASRDKLLVAPRQRLLERYKLDVRMESSVEAIDRARNMVRVRELTSGREYELTYDKLILSTGAAPFVPPLPGANLPGIFTLRDLADSDRIKAAVDGGAKAAVIVGAGFIGLEMAENFVHRSLATSVVELVDQILPPWDKEMTTDAAEHLRQKGVALYLGDQVTAFEPAAAGGISVKLKSGGQLPADLVILSVGVKPENRLAVAAGLDVGPRGGIRVNPHMQTSDADIYAVGDAVEVEDYVLKTPTQVPLAGPANRQGRIAADHIFGRVSRYRGTQGTAILRVFDMTLAMTGASEKALVRAQKPLVKVYVHPAHHAGYYPGAEGMTLKLLFDPASGKILGAQASGGAGVDKRIDVLAVAIQAGMTVYDLEEMELAYSPQYGSAKDPVNMLGFVAANLLRGDHPQISASELAAGGEAALLLDVRTPTEFAAGHVPGAVNIPIDVLRQRLGELPKDQPIVAYCQLGMRGYLATRILIQHGYPVRNLSGGYKSYRQTVPAG